MKFRIKPEHIVTDEHGQTYNIGGRRLMPYESPTGQVVEPGETFEAPVAWYESRQHWHFLEAAGFEEIKSAEDVQPVEDVEPTKSRRTVEEEFLFRDLPDSVEAIVEKTLDEEPVVGTKRTRKRRAARQTETD